MSIGFHIKEAREHAGWSQKRLADESGMSLMSIRRYERDEREPKPSQLIKIADALGVQVSQLSDGIIYMSTHYSESLVKKVDAEVKKLLENRDVPTHEAMPASIGEESIAPSKKQLESQMVSDYQKLNQSGAQEAVKRVNELTQIPKYTEPEE